MKAFFLSRVLREKILLLGLILFGAGAWLLSATHSTTRFWQRFSETSASLKWQSELLAQQGQVEAEAMAAIKYLDPAKTFDNLRLQAEVDAIARRTGLTGVALERVQTERSKQISINSMPMTIRNADWPKLKEFYIELAKSAPYIGIDQFSIRVANFKHNVSMRISSIEVAK